MRYQLHSGVDRQIKSKILSLAMVIAFVSAISVSATRVILEENNKAAPPYPVSQGAPAASPSGQTVAAPFNQPSPAAPGGSAAQASRVMMFNGGYQTKTAPTSPYGTKTAQPKNNSCLCSAVRPSSGTPTSPSPAAQPSGSLLPSVNLPLPLPAL